MAPKTPTNGRRAPTRPQNGRHSQTPALAGVEGTRRNVGGRPRVEIDWAVFDALCGVRCTLAEIASHFDCSEDTIERAVQRDKSQGFADYYRQKEGRGAVALRRKQYQLALNGNVTMLIWLGKQRLGQTDKQVHEVGGTEGAPVMFKLDLASASLARLHE